MLLENSQAPVADRSPAGQTMAFNISRWVQGLGASGLGAVPGQLKVMRESTLLGGWGSRREGL